MLYNFVIGFGLIIITGGIHSFATNIVFNDIVKKGKARTHLKRIILIDLVILLIIIASLLESSLWAITYLRLGAVSSFEEALYFSLVTFTSLGYGDIVLSNEFRLLGALESANGVIIFGWSTAIVVGTLQKLYTKPND